MSKYSKKSSTLESKTPIIVGVALIVCLATAFFSFPSYASYCKEPQAKCELNTEHSVMNIMNTLSKGS